MGFRRRPIGRLRWTVLLLTVGALLSLGFLLIPTTREALQSMGSSKRLQLIMLALESYHDANGCYPPQYITDAKGKPAAQLRVLILPYFGHEDLYQRYSFDEPWNGPHNRGLVQEMPF